MNNRVGFLARALVTLLAAATFSAQAFTLGDLRGTAVIGRVLDVSVRVQGGPGEAVSASCVGADVYFSDARQAAPLVTVTGGADAVWVVRVQSASVVNEPVLTVLVRSTCGSSTMRRYVMLADFPQMAPLAQPAPMPSVNPLAQAASLAPVMAQAAPMLVLPSVAQPTEVVVAVAKKAGKAPGTSREPKAKKTPVSVAEPTASVVRKVADKPARAPGKSVLKLDPLDLLSDRIDSLDATMLFAPTEDALRHTQQITALQSDVKTLRDLAANNDARLADLRTQLQQAQEQQMPMWVVYLLLALVLLCLGAVTWLWNKQRQAPKVTQPSWWHDEESGSPSTILMPQPSSNTEATPLKAAFTVKSATRSAPVASIPTETPPAQATAEPLTPVLPLNEVDLDIDLDTFMLAEKPSAAPQTTPQDAAELAAQPVHHISADAVLDIRQQAEFFVSLGQTERALSILSEQIATSAQPNPLVHLDLLGLYHSLGLKTDFREEREVFRRLFNAQVPDFPAFNLEGKDLVAYPEVLSKLAPHWPGEHALAFLDTLIFHDTKAQVRPMFDLAAFRDLLLLHALAEDLAPALASPGSMPLPNVVPVGPVASAKPPATAPVAAVMATLELVPNSAPALPKPSLPSVDEPRADAKALAAAGPLPAHLDAFASDLVLAPMPEAPSLQVTPSPTTAPKPVTAQQSAASLQPSKSPLPILSEAETPSVEESPSRMLDLDFSSLLLPPSVAAKPADDIEPIIKPPVRYATRSRWPVVKKPK